MSSAEAVLINSGGVAAAGWYGVRWLRDRAAGRPSGERRRRADQANRAFAAALGLDPAAVIGPGPAAAVGADSPAVVGAASAVIGREPARR